MFTNQQYIQKKNLSYHLIIDIPGVAGIVVKVKSSTGIDTLESLFPYEIELLPFTWTCLRKLYHLVLDLHQEACVCWH